MASDWHDRADFIDQAAIFAAIEKAKDPEPALVRDTLTKAAEKKGLEPFEAAALLQNRDPDLDQAIFETAVKVKKDIYGNRLVLFAPLYITNECQNRCAYCAFSTNNRDLVRRTLTIGEIKAEVAVLEGLGHKRLLLVYGEHPRFGAEWIAETMQAVYDTVTAKSGVIRRVNVNCAPMEVEGFRRLKEAGIGTYQCFQETYHAQTYAKYHPAGRKADRIFRLYALHRAQAAGIDDVATGALFGLFDHRFEVLALLAHARQMEQDFGVGPHTLSFPRLEPAQNSDISVDPPYPISDHDFKKVVAVLRLAVPYTGLILTTREKPDLRRELLNVGVSQLSAGSRTYPGAYSDPRHDRPEVQQFCVGDSRPLDEVIRDIVESLGYIPSWCTACYRLGRTGDHFMTLAKQGFIQRFCLPNALLTFHEYLLDYGSEETRAVGGRLLAKEIAGIADPSSRRSVEERIRRLDNGERDLYF